MTTRTWSAGDLEGKTVRSMDGEKLGKVDDMHVDRMGGPMYIEVKTGWFGANRHAIPCDRISLEGDDIVVPYTREQLENAPTLEEAAHLDYDRERELGRHYGHTIAEWDDDRDRWTEEDLTRGPTPETRGDFGHRREAAGGRRGRDTSDGPTPETRAVMAATDESRDPDRERFADRETARANAGRMEADRIRYMRWSRWSI